MSSAPTNPWGRVDDDGNVYVKTSDGERLIGQWPGGDPAEAMSLYVRRFEGLEVEVDLLEKRLKGGTVSPDDAAKAVTKVRGLLVDAQAMGDLDSLVKRLDALQPAIDEQREQRKAERAAKVAEAQTEKTRIADEAEKIAAGSDWKNGADKLRALLDEWKALPRLSKSADDELWHRFSSARTAYTRRRKAHFGEQSTLRDAAKAVKEKLIVEAEALSTSTEWGPTAGKYRDLMTEWKKAGSAPRNVEDKLWKRFRAAQDAFFTARDEANSALDAEYEVNAEKKLEILAEAEKLLPIKNVDAARKAWLDIADRWEAAGKVPRAKIGEFEAKIRKVEQAVKDATESQWKKTDPEKSARADDMIGKLQRSIDEVAEKIAAAEAKGDTKKVKDLTADLESKQAFLEMAKKAQADFS
ncbi:DUF349 domain-containing protein [Aeromicrobium wangtongii]|uniref:DUF349 domain-containing protein n=1 Tax=Aeromicrobium wangtongii TaxID=2969247 RepID=A0ABY5M418_9ACTN|nr:DUF349 domain-containing protein [Aeromicrobium wangtongii]MCD9198190.1 DUF349 domain-containing protein [Aeromicrobium wangtongii]UUP12227.1 DUF349 domain-containing protein [Aeromicrobium wangtongii]